MTATREPLRPARPGPGYIVPLLIAGFVTPLRAPRGAWTARLVPAWRRFAPMALPLVAVMAAIMIWVDVPTMRAMTRLPPTFVDVVNEITDFGRGAWPLTPLAVLLLATPILCLPTLSLMARGTVTTMAVRLGYMFAAIALTGLADSIIKRMIGRARPWSFDPDPFTFHPFSWKNAYASLPSGHATNVFATMVAVGLVFPRLRPLLWVYAVGIAASRVIVSAHFPSDVLAGAAFGAFGAIVIRDWFARRRLGFFVGSDGRVHPLPGPSFGRIKKVARALFGQ
jgi:undecaprenyl-diphosphatase